MEVGGRGAVNLKDKKKESVSFKTLEGSAVLLAVSRVPPKRNDRRGRTEISSPLTTPIAWLCSLSWALSAAGVRLGTWQNSPKQQHVQQRRHRKDGWADCCRVGNKAREEERAGAPCVWLEHK